MNSYSSINPSSANASGSVTPPVNTPLPGSCLSCCTAFPRSPCTSSAFQSTRSKVLDTTYFLAASIVRAKGFHPIGPRARPRRRPPRCLHHFVSHPAKEEGIGLDEVLDRVTMQVFVRDHGAMIAAPVQCDVDGIPKGSH